jgi:ABC-type Zn uptake system ZnuABC Zn-binding protein ZnuA
MSKRAREEALKREHDRLFPPGFWDDPKTLEQLAKEKATALRRSASNLRELADKGMSPKKFRKKAEQLEQEAAAIELTASSVV